VDENQKNPMSSTKNAGFVDGVNFFTERRMSELADDSAGISDCDRVGRISRVDSLRVDCLGSKCGLCIIIIVVILSYAKIRTL